MSDSHDNMSNLAKAVRLFNEGNLRYVLHAGDFTTDATFRVLRDLKAEFIGVFGNNDGGMLTPGDAGPLIIDNQWRTHGRIYRQPHEFTIGNRRFAMIHEHFDVDAIAQSGRCDCLIYGHTHRPEAVVRNGTYVLNPGELCGWLHGSATVAVIDTQSMVARIIGLD
ncbi:MAG: metallophosphoesterase [Nitrospirae bacterium]|nr:metallophosphoesterase [Nitrospirota bacterium]